MGENNERRFGVLVACFAATLYLALVVATFGLVGLFTDREVLAGPPHGPLLEPTMVAAAALAVFIECVFMSRIRAGATLGVSLVRSIAVGFVAYLVYLVTGGIVVGVSAGGVMSGVVFIGEIALTPFAAAIGIIATVTTILFAAAIAYRARNDYRPRWPWERDI